MAKLCIYTCLSKGKLGSLFTQQQFLNLAELQNQACFQTIHQESSQRAEFLETHCVKLCSEKLLSVTPFSRLIS